VDTLGRSFVQSVSMLVTAHQADLAALDDGVRARYYYCCTRLRLY